MKIAYIHYHLKTGGVTTVLRHQVTALKPTDDILVLTGEANRSAFPANTVVIDGLGYDTPPRASPPVKEVADAILTAIHNHFNGPCDLLHVHNPTIAKNKHLLKILKRLQQAGVALFLQIHDLAEDGRPGLFYREVYPSDCHFGVINRRDYRLLRRGGLEPEGLHLVPNMVESDFSISDAAAASTVPNDFILYPVRAIRRKNIGEAVLLSLFFKNSATLVITLPPNSPADVAAHDGWIRFVQANDLNVVFNAGLRHDFGRLFQKARFLLTTSISEGFGFSFLEPWLAGKFLWGRKLPDICSDFEAKGVVLDHLYAKLSIPLDWLPRNSLFSRWKACLRINAHHFQRTMDSDDIDAAFASVTTGNHIDFGLLDEFFQKRIISRIVTDRSIATELIHLNPFLAQAGPLRDPDQLIESNRRAVSTGYNAADYQKTLRRIYGRVAGTKVTHRLDNTPLVDYFLNPSHFSLLKWCDYAEE